MSPLVLPEMVRSHELLGHWSIYVGKVFGVYQYVFQVHQNGRRTKLSFPRAFILGRSPGE